MKKVINTFLLFTLISSCLFSQIRDYQAQLKGLDGYMEKILKDWNAPGVGIGIVVKDKLIFAKGYGYRDYEKKLPVTENTLYQIASNTKLFTAIDLGMLVDKGKLEWDKPIKKFVPTIQFYNDYLNNSVTIRDMLSHRTGLSRHDMIWYKSDLSRKDLFEKIKYLEPSQSIREVFLYNNIMYSSAGYIIELLTGKTWEEFTKEKILEPLDMKNTVFSIAEMTKQNDYFVPYNEKRDTTILYKIPYYETAGAIAPAGTIISNISDMSKWLITLMNGGRYNGSQIISPNVINATLTPAIPYPNNYYTKKGFNELLNVQGGLGRRICSYRGHLLLYHGGDINGIHSQFSCMPNDSLGVIVFSIGDHTYPLYDEITFNIYEMLLGIEITPWNERNLEDITKEKIEGRKARAKVGSDKVTGTNPSHTLELFTGQYSNPAYGIVDIKLNNGQLQFNFHKIQLPLIHYHYDRFDTPNDEENGLFSLNFYTNSQGDIDKLKMSLDESEVEYIRQADASLSDPQKLSKFTGKYEGMGNVLEVIQKNENQIFLIVPGQPAYQLEPIKEDTFRIKQFSDITIKFTIEENLVKYFEQIDPSGVYKYIKK